MKIKIKNALNVIFFFSRYLLLKLFQKCKLPWSSSGHQVKPVYREPDPDPHYKLSCLIGIHKYER